jgi:hypothetical protein
MTLVETAARLVVRTHTWPGLGGLYRAGYELGLTYAARHLASVPGVLAVLVRLGHSGRTWVPGLSDYDLTVLTDRAGVDPMLRFLDALWARYRWIKRRVPQLGEMEVMDLEEYRDFLSAGPMATASLKHTEVLFARGGHDELDLTLRHPPHACGTRELLLDALTRYLRFLLPAWLRHATMRSHATRLGAEHLLANVFKRLTQLDAQVEADGSLNLADGMARAFIDLTRICGRTAAPDGPLAEVEHRMMPAPVEARVACFEAHAAELLGEAGVRDGSVVSWLPFMSADAPNVAVVVPDDLPESGVRILFEALARRHRAGRLSAPTPVGSESQRYFPSFAHAVVLSRSMWKGWRELSPFEGAAVAASGRTRMGPDDDLRDPPPIAALRRGAQVQFATLLPLRNNWRPLGGPPSPALYETMVNHAAGCRPAPALLRTWPMRRGFRSLDESYRAITEELRTLGKEVLA